MRFAVLSLVLTSVFTFAAPANAANEATAADEVTARADLNGDGVLDTVVAQAIEGNPDEQLLVATINGVRLDARVPLYSRIGVPPLQVVDLNDDGTDEVMVTEALGANTVTVSTWGLYGGLRPVTWPNGEVMKVWEGGGISSLSAYGCEQAGGGRRLVQVSTSVDWNTLIYSGDRITYSLAGSVATETSRVPVSGKRDDPALQTDPAACA
ncbi:hypothetical protein ACFFQW_35395 [Umezawaea endophytica]|uniref:VCBS repeat protein n=1 Tax=Umezawaea endophytica TaxID=1654476 RepID=A0A9X2VIJ6_9PSEU|nr:hypothetical protein [Umezawaea endophytica]MCS7475688.1 hypothetical protein [Umezawaea endophytica]